MFGFIGEFNLNRPKEYGAQNYGKALNCDPPDFFPGTCFNHCFDRIKY